MAIPSYPPPLIQFTSVQSLSCVQLFAAPWTAASHGQASLSITNSWRLLKLMFTKSVMPSNHLILYCPLFLLPSIFPSIRVFSDELALHIKWPKYSFSISTSPSNEYSGLISFRMDWFDLLAVLGTLKALLQHQNSKASILWPFLSARHCSGHINCELTHSLLTKHHEGHTIFIPVLPMKKIWLSDLHKTTKKGWPEVGSGITCWQPDS